MCFVCKGTVTLFNTWVDVNEVDGIYTSAETSILVHMHTRTHANIYTYIHTPTYMLACIDQLTSPTHTNTEPCADITT